jgi:hypothetical protein
MKHLSRLTSSAELWNAPRTAWTRADDDSAALEKAAAAALERKAKATKIESYCKTRIEFELESLSIESDRFFVPFNPPRFKRNKKGELKEEKMPMEFLSISAGPLEFRIFKNTDPGNVIRRSHEIRRRCGEAAAKKFTDTALPFLKPKESKPERKPLENPFHLTASGICNRFRKGKMQAEIGSPMFEYKDSEQAEKDILKSATLADAFSAADAMRKAFAPSRRRKAA